MTSSCACRTLSCVRVVAVHVVWIASLRDGSASLLGHEMHVPTDADLQPGSFFSCKFCTMCAHGGAVTALALAPSCEKLATGSAESGLLIWAVDTRRVQYALEGHFDWVLSLTFSAAGKWLVSTSRDRTARVWDAYSWKALQTLWGHKGAVTAARFVGVADNLLTVTDQTLRLWDSKTWRCFSSFDTCHAS